MNEELYELLEQEFLKYHIGEEVEDVLLALAETLADQNVLGEEVSCRERAGKTVLEACGVCEEDEDGEIRVFIKTLTIGEEEFEIEDYLL